MLKRNNNKIKTIRIYLPTNYLSQHKTQKIKVIFLKISSKNRTSKINYHSNTVYQPRKKLFLIKIEPSMKSGIRGHPKKSFRFGLLNWKPIVFVTTRVFRKAITSGHRFNSEISFGGFTHSYLIGAEWVLFF